MYLETLLDCSQRLSKVLESFWTVLEGTVLEDSSMLSCTTVRQFWMFPFVVFKDDSGLDKGRHGQPEQDQRIRYKCKKDMTHN